MNRCTKRTRYLVLMYHNEMQLMIAFRKIGCYCVDIPFLDLAERAVPSPARGLVC
jgi:hypothetical protein